MVRELGIPNFQDVQAKTKAELFVCFATRSLVRQGVSLGSNNDGARGFGILENEYGRVNWGGQL